MAPKKPVKPTKLQVKADQKNKVLTGPKGSKPQSTTTNRVRTQGGTTMSKPKPNTRFQNPSKGGSKTKSQTVGGGGAKPAPKPATPKPTRASIGNVRGPGGRGRPASAQATDTRKFQAMNQSASARAGQAAEPRPRTAAPGTGNVLKTAQQFSKDKAAQQRQVNRGVAAFRSNVNQSMVGKAAALVGGLRGGAMQAIADTVAPRATAKGTLKGGGAVGPNMPKRLLEQRGLAAQERKARAKNEARKKATGSSSATPNTAKSFDDAFKDARRAKVGSFTWRGKKYTTEMK